MSWQYTPYTLPLLAAAAVSAALAFLAWRRRPTPGAASFAVLMLAVAEWSLGYALELGSIGLPAKVFWSNINFFGIVTVPTAWLVFALQYAGKESWLTRRNLIILLVEPFVTLLLTWTNEFHGLLRSDVTLDTSGSLPMLAPTYGPGFWVYAAYSYLLIVFSTFLFLQVLFRSPRLYRGQAIAVLIGALAPWVGNALHIFGLSPFPHLDLTPLAFTITGLAVAWGLFRFRLLDITPVARDTVLENMSDGVLILDPEGRIVDLNPAATQMIGRPAVEVIGQSSAQLLTDWPDLTPGSKTEQTHSAMILGEGKAQRHFDLSISPLHDWRGRFSGRLLTLRDVTENKRAEKALLESEERFRMLSDATEEGIAIHDQGVIVEANQALARLFGYELSELIGMSAEPLATPDSWKTIVEHIVAAYDRPYEVIGVRRDGSTFRCELVGKPYQYQGRTLRVATFRDITGRKQAEEALQQRNRELALLNRTSRTLTSTLDLDQVLITILEEVQSLLGVVACSVWLIDPETKELVCRQATGPQGSIIRGWRLAPGQGFVGWVMRTGESLIVPDTRTDERHFKDVEHQVGLTLRSIISVPLRIQERVFGVLQVVDTEVNSFQPSDLTLLEPLAAAAAIAIENAQLYRTLRNHADQLEQQVQKRTAEVQAQYARLEAILDSVSDGIIVTDARGEILLANPVADAWLTKTLSAEDAARLQGAVRDLAQRTEERPETVLELRGLDLELRAAPISKPGAEEATVVVAVHDISQLKSLDRMKSRFASNVSHELRTPITTIKLYAYLMQQKPERWRDYLDVLAQEADRQAQLVEDVLQMSRIDAGRLDIKPFPTHLNQLTEIAIDSHQALAQEQGTVLEHRPAQPGPIALVDPERIVQVLNNLVGNAIRYTSRGGKVVVSTRKKKAKGLTWATATVADTGMGIPEEELPHIFERFYRGETPQANQISGTGLGLAIAQEIVKMHEGWITVKSQVGEGATFTVWLPLAPERARL